MTPDSRQTPESIGGKAASLALLQRLGLPVPPSAVIGVDNCRLAADRGVAAIGETLRGAIAGLEKDTHLKFGDAAKPLLLAVRCSATTTIPGMADAVLNLGLNDETVGGLAAVTGDQRHAQDCYGRFIQNYAHVAMGDDPTIFEDVHALYMEERGYVSATELQGSDSSELVDRFKAQYESNNGAAFPQDPWTQLQEAVQALLRAWNAPRAKAHRKIQGIENSGLAIILQAMVQTDANESCGIGRAITRNAVTGRPELTLDFVPQGTGQDLAMKLKAGKVNDAAVAESLGLPAEAQETLLESLARLEDDQCDGMDVEFALESGKLWFLQARPQRRSAAAALHMAVEFAEQGLMSREQALMRVDPLSLDQLLHATINPETKRTLIAAGLPASPGAVSGLIIFDAEEARELASQGRRVILVRPETLPEDVRGLHAAEGVLTTRGGMASHAAVIARGMGKPCVTGASTLKIDTSAGTLTAPGIVLKRWDIITLDGSTGQILKGAVPTEKPEVSGDFATLLSWADTVRRMKVRANAETVQDARMARDFGAEGIGLCRTEHMFFEGDRLVAMREMILADKEKDRRAALAKVLPMLRGDFVSLFEIMAGTPVTIRLLDPPLHEFLPDAGPDVEAVAKSLGADPAVLGRRVMELKEQNPMLGHRGVRLLLSYPEIVEMQARAIFEAVAQMQKETDTPPIPEIMVPLVASRAELDLVRARIDATAIAVEKETGVTLAYRVGTMIELPRAALKAGDIAQ